jgi:hypothetical protein
MKGIELKPLRDRDYLLKFVAADEDNDFTYEEADREFFQDGRFVFGYEVFNNGIRHGVAFSLLCDGLYSLDGYNTSPRFHMAVLAGKAVVKKLFDKYTDVVFTEHHKDNLMVTLLAKKIGFINFETFGDKNVMVIEKEI